MLLYYSPGASSLAAHIALEWANAEYQAVEVDLDGAHGSHRRPHAGACAPVLTHGRLILTDDIAVLHYVAESHPSASLLGGPKPSSRAAVAQWLALLNAEVHNAFNPLFAMQVQDGDDCSGAGAARVLRGRLRAHFEQVDRQIEGGDWLLDSRSVADPYLFVMVRWAKALEIDLDGLPSVAAFHRHMRADPAVRTALFAEEGVVV